MDKDSVKIYIEKALTVMKFAYAPYSGFQVGALVVDENGTVSTGCNVENASYGLTICAERNAIAFAVAKGMKKISLLVLVSSADSIVTPCGACRQVIAEFSDISSRIICADKNCNYREYTIEDLLPGAFTR